MSKSNPNCPKTGTDSHASSCYTVTYPSCGKVAHKHSGNACYYSKGDNKGQLKCTAEEHAHSRSACASATGPLCGGV